MCQSLLVGGSAQGLRGINWEKKEEDIVENMDKGLTDAEELEPGEKLLVQKHFPTPPLK